MEMDIEKTTRESLSFVEQLQNQIQLCREALSDMAIPLTPKVEALEVLLWAKLKDDVEYNKTLEDLNKEFQKRREIIKSKVEYWKVEKALSPYVREKSKEKFKAIMIFIDKKGYMPLGER